MAILLAKSRPRAVAMHGRSRLRLRTLPRLHEQRGLDHPPDLVPVASPNKTPSGDTTRSRIVCRPSSPVGASRSILAVTLESRSIHRVSGLSTRAATGDPVNSHTKSSASWTMVLRALHHGLSSGQFQASVGHTACRSPGVAMAGGRHGTGSPSAHALRCHVLRCFLAPLVGADTSPFRRVRYGLTCARAAL
jgi:hypothetical protein